MLRRFWDTSGPIVLALALVMALALVAAISLTLAKFSEVLRDAVAARHEIHATELRFNIETGVNLGLDLKEIAGNVEVIVLDRFDLDSGIARIAVTAVDGSTVFAKDRADLDGGAAAAPAAELAQTALPIVNSFGAVEGHVTVTYRADANDRVIAEAGRSLMRDVAVVAAISAIVAAIGCLAIMAPLLRGMGRARAVLDAPPGTALPTADPADGPLETAAREALAGSARTLDALDRIDAQITAAHPKAGPKTAPGAGS